jgi:hypothetical protein
LVGPYSRERVKLQVVPSNKRRPISKLYSSSKRGLLIGAYNNTWTGRVEVVHSSRKRGQVRVVQQQPEEVELGRTASAKRGKVGLYHLSRSVGSYCAEEGENFGL